MIPRYSSVALLAQTSNGLCVLLQLRDEGAPRYPHYWVLPGGGVDTGESFDAAVRRELSEELDIGNPRREDTLSELTLWAHYDFLAKADGPKPESCAQEELRIHRAACPGLDIDHDRQEHLYSGKIQPRQLKRLTEGRLADFIPVSAIVQGLYMLPTDRFMLCHFLTASGLYKGAVQNPASQ